MMSIWHLLWIIPLAGSIGFATAVLLAANGQDDDYTGDGK